MIYLERDITINDSPSCDADSLIPNFLPPRRYLLVWGNGAPIPGFPRPRSEFSGTRQGWGEALQKFRGIFGDGLNFGVFWGFSPENPQKIIGETLGTVIGSSLGIYVLEVSPPKKTQFSGIPRKSPFWWILRVVCLMILVPLLTPTSPLIRYFVNAPLSIKSDFANHPIPSYVILIQGPL